MNMLDSTPGRIACINGEAYLFFSGYNYLGIQQNEEFLNLVKQGMENNGSLFPSSRISNTRLELFDTFESALSTLTGMQDTVSFSSGYLAATAVSDCLLNAESYIAPGTHPALSGNYPVSNESFNIWSERIVRQIENSTSSNSVIAADAVDIMQSRVNNFDFLTLINRQKKITCIIDDSHGIGILGDDGEGIISKLPFADNIKYVLTYSLSKAFSIHGGAVSCNAETAMKLRKSAAYSGSTAINPAMAYAFLHATGLYKSQRMKLLSNIKLFSALSPQALHDPGLPIFIVPGDIDIEALISRKIIISSFAYPFPQSEAVNRVIVNALHTEEDLQSCAESLIKVS